MMTLRDQMVALGAHVFQLAEKCLRRERHREQVVFAQQPQAVRGILTPLVFQNTQRIVQSFQYLLAV